MNSVICVVSKFNVRLALGATLLASVALVSGCAKPSASANVYTYGQAQRDQVVRNGTIVNVRPITIQK
jgi:outer membrane lipoprotein SlyB